ncbi:MAG TPA: hypothetical protein VFH10_16135 [Nocardioides sp.]|uniref:hypothetical protein n=1 Tax=Nocardioides sp. TaxID=35761 RepID=UPI002D7F8AA0|nr:hypothetical protein [Nocardioides sp.]HET6654167.1 hypothetical protein [Nocardioides sp.]
MAPFTDPAPGPWRLRLAGRELVAAPLPRVGGVGTPVEVAVDGRVVTTLRATWTGSDVPLAELAPEWDLAGLRLEGASLQVRSGRRGRLRTVRLVVPPAAPGAGPGRAVRPEVVELEPPPGTRAWRRWDLARRHPRWYAARHVAVATAQVLFGLVAVSLAVGWIPWGWLPSIPLPDLPSVPLPSVPWPSVPLPDVTVPDWVRAVMDSKKYWFPILVAGFVARAELRRRRHRDAQGAGDGA